MVSDIIEYWPYSRMGQCSIGAFWIREHQTLSHIKGIMFSENVQVNVLRLQWTDPHFSKFWRKKNTTFIHLSISLSLLRCKLLCIIQPKTFIYWLISAHYWFFNSFSLAPTTTTVAPSNCPDNWVESEVFYYIRGAQHHWERSFLLVNLTISKLLDQFIKNCAIWLFWYG